MDGDAAAEGEDDDIGCDGGGAVIGSDGGGKERSDVGSWFDGSGGLLAVLHHCNHWNETGKMHIPIFGGEEKIEMAAEPLLLRGGGGGDTDVGYDTLPEHQFWVFDEPLKATVVSVSRPDTARDVTPLHFSYTIELQYKQFGWSLVKKGSQILYLHLALKKRPFNEQSHEKQENLAKEWLHSLGIDEEPVEFVQDPDQSDDGVLPLLQDESVSNRYDPSSGEHLEIAGKTLKEAMQSSLDHLLGDLGIVDSREVCKFLEVSKLSFALEYGPKLKEGYVMMRHLHNIFKDDANVWAVLKPGFLALLEDPFDTKLVDIVLFDVVPPPSESKGSPLYVAEQEGNPSRYLFKVASGSRSIELRATSSGRVEEWVHAINDAAAKPLVGWSHPHRFGSFAPPRGLIDDGSDAQWFVDGQAAFESIASSIEKAKSEILIAGWWLWAEYYLRRPFQRNSISRLDSLLEAKAKEGIQVASGSRSIELRATSSGRVEEWVHAINDAAAKHLVDWSHPHRFGSFAPPRGLIDDGSHAQWFVDGQAAFEAIASSIEKAKSEILITGWWLWAEYYLRRPFQRNSISRLDSLLEAKAKEGVQIYVLLFKEISLAMKTNSACTEKMLRNLHENVRVIRHPDHFSTGVYYWSHHEKLAVVDYEVCFLGGLDFCFGRYDNMEHRLGDCPPHIWPGKDYYNPRESEPNCYEDIMKDEVDRKNYPRMPWHDVHCALWGPPCRDAARHFVQRWNHAKRNKAANEHKIPLLIPHHHIVLPHYMGKSEEINFESVSVEEDHEGINCRSSVSSPSPMQMGPRAASSCQILRSVSQWSSGTSQPEQSIHNAYCSLIEKAQHFIYIENQYFISGFCGDETIQNRVVDALYKRILQAHKDQKCFRVIVVMPLVPEFPGRLDASGAATVRAIMHWQFRTIAWEKTSILYKLYSQLGPKTHDYISFYALRTHGRLFERGPLITSQVYVHTKAMILDDRVAIIGSANINDRSLLGLRDSEIGVCIEDKEFVESSMNGVPWKAGKFAHSLRCSLWSEHLGLGSEEMSKITDPISERTYRDLWMETAKENTMIYQEVFACLPNDLIQTRADLKSCVKEKKEKCGDPTVDLSVALEKLLCTDDGKVKIVDPSERLKSVKGHLVSYPLKFLCQEDLRPAFSEVEFYACPQVFQ